MLLTYPHRLVNPQLHAIGNIFLAIADIYYIFFTPRIHPFSYIEVDKTSEMMNIYLKYSGLVLAVIFEV